jgi:hypothetical protein
MGANHPERQRMYRITPACNGVPVHLGAEAARDITEEFTHRPWHQNVRCEWDGSRLILQAENDFDSNGLALRNEFSDAISASIKDGIDGGINVVSISPLPIDVLTHALNRPTRPALRAAHTRDKDHS